MRRRDGENSQFRIADNCERQRRLGVCDADSGARFVENKCSSGKKLRRQSESPVNLAECIMALYTAKQIARIIGGVKKQRLENNIFE